MKGTRRYKGHAGMKGTRMTKKVGYVLLIAALIIILYAFTNTRTTISSKFYLPTANLWNVRNATSGGSISSKLVDSFWADNRRKESRILSTIDSNWTRKAKRMIMLPTRFAHLQGFGVQRFNDCEISNCAVQFGDELNDAITSDVVVIEFYSKLKSNAVALNIKPNHPIIVLSHESPAQPHHRWKSSLNLFSGTMTYSPNSTFYYPFGATMPLRFTESSLNSPQINYARGKTKGAYAYVSSCDTLHYNRLEAMKQLSRYIDVDIFGQCTDDSPCSRLDVQCEAKMHAEYRFYLAFENSVCKDYITEKFWKALQSPAHFVPVALGGFSVNEYNQIAPPESFLHVYNFSSLEHLGRYMQYLIKNDVAYNRYHQWKQKFVISNLDHENMCNLCKLAYDPSLLDKNQGQKHADDWNNPKNCINFLDLKQLLANRTRKP